MNTSLVALALVLAASDQPQPNTLADKNVELERKVAELERKVNELRVAELERKVNALSAPTTLAPRLPPPLPPVAAPVVTTVSIQINLGGGIGYGLRPGFGYLGPVYSNPAPRPITQPRLPATTRTVPRR